LDTKTKSFIYFDYIQNPIEVQRNVFEDVDSNKFGGQAVYFSNKLFSFCLELANVNNKNHFKILVELLYLLV